MAGNPRPQIPGSTAPSVGYAPTRPGTAQKFPRYADRDASPLSIYSPSAAVTRRSDSILPTDVEGTTLPQAAASKLLDAITEARRRLLGRLAHT